MFISVERLILAAEFSLRNSLIVQSPLRVTQLRDQLLEANPVFRCEKRDGPGRQFGGRRCYRALTGIVAVEPATTGRTDKRREFQEWQDTLFHKTLGVASFQVFICTMRARNHMHLRD